MHLAQINIARMIAPLDDPIMRDFVENLNPMNALAEKAPGFIWRLIEEENNATSIRVFNDNFLIVNMSVWTDISALKTFVYQTDHLSFLKRRKEWFESMKDGHMAMWYIEEGRTPTIPEAVEKLIHLRNRGVTLHSFTFRKAISEVE